MKFLDLQAQYYSIKEEIDQVISTVIKQGDFILGKKVSELEEKIATYVGVKHAVGLNSGSDALTVSLKALGIGKGDEVIVPAFTYIATAEAVAIAGAKIVFVDINPDTYNIDPPQIEKAISKKTKAIIPVHLYGQPAEMDKIVAIAKVHELFVIEDAAQAIGAEFDDKKIGSIGDIGCLSFFPTKNLGAYGDGGMITTNNTEVADYIRKWRIHGQEKKYYTNFVGASSRLDTLQAAILLVKLKYLNEWTKSRQAKAQVYNTLLSDIPAIKLPRATERQRHVFHQYTIRVSSNRDQLVTALKEKNIPSMIYYPLPLHLQTAYKKLGHHHGDFPESEKASNEVLSLPIYPEITDEDQQFISRSIKDFFQNKH